MLRLQEERDRVLEQNKQHLTQMLDNLEDTVKAIAKIVEMRDPYTAGHQLRVAALAAAIARQMGLPDAQVHAIHLAGVLHDLGKIQIPAEILSKPSRLNTMEYSLIQFHPQAGYDILQGIKFPWPIAQMVLQHHERLDGSGYPQRLKSDAILLEARILAVSDVVEAISSHRPYRPALGIEAALAEIEQASGSQFDPAVVAACIKVVSDHGMKLPE
jgi:putative nucleotidyltransferase with HDIG domain